MSKFIKRLIGAALGVLILIGIGAAAQPVEAAAPKRVDVVLHKLLFQDSLPESQLNDGHAQPDFGQASKPLNGVTFTAYDVTGDFWRLVDQGASVEDAQDQVAAADFQVAAGAELSSVVTAGQGQAAFDQLPLREGGRYAVYLFKETAAPDGITASQNLVVVMPGNLEGGVQSRIDLFPKNQMTHGYAEIDKTIENNRTNFGYGDPIPYRIAVKVPANIGALTSFKLTDTADTRLERIGGLTVTVDGKAADDLYTVTKADSHSFALTFDVAKLTPLANKTITVTYQMRIRPGTVPDAPLVNRTVLYPGDFEPVTDTAVVITGGKRFVKVDAEHHGTKLQGAVFVVRNTAGEYLVQEKTGWTWRRVAGDVVKAYHRAGLHTLVSAKDGRFAITGLKAGAYTLIEVKAPRGYTRNAKAIPFAVVAGEYTRGLADPYNVINVKTPVTPPHKPGEPTTPGQPGKPGLPPRLPLTGGHLPQTGGEWAAWLSILGLILIGLVAAVRVKTKKA
ncbi:SpaH/EbpB family LPXTG-anchored major pilin [Lacticaseibacillus kribbianus]|uniref:SpaH/EbpB family LPXTG-anchored major pilin n=1 Tax=Lacticaseibacillus kribbianus TaxID=2926292 RepID=UPI001CD4EC9B|nr:SpaH/EbpB family LPXTG-anchored major pilin [Lacticaseibacillus kribbianus]